jgi:hypothetical protein
MDIARLILVLLSCLMFVLVVITLVRAGRGSPTRGARIIDFPEGEEWMSLEEVSEALGTDRDRIIELVERDAIPYFVDVRSGRAAGTIYWFRRDEIDAWTVG